MITVITRTANRPRYFAKCRRSVLQQTERAFHLVISDTPEDDYPEGDLVLRVPRLQGRGHNLYFNQAAKHIPPSHPWVMFLDDDDQMGSPFTLESVIRNIIDENSLLLWYVEIDDGFIVPNHSFGKPPLPGNISGIGFCYHSRHWMDWPPESLGDFKVISELYKKLNPVWIEAVLTCTQDGPGHGLREDLITENVHLTTS